MIINWGATSPASLGFGLALLVDWSAAAAAVITPTVRSLTLEAYSSPVDITLPARAQTPDALFAVESVDV